jgi:DMSO/TMAO reductase YedYZ molybdopterin-dependent catalytic subunit
LVWLKEMEKVKRHKAAIIAAIVVLLLVFVIVETVIQQPPSPPQNLYPEQIRDYEGEHLSSIVDVFENAIRGTQYLNQTGYHLTVTGLVNQTIEYTYDEVISNYTSYQKVTTIHCIEGWSAKILWEGILVRDLIKEAGNTSQANTVIFTASDGYTTSLPLDYFFTKDILLAYKMNGVTIPPERGYPFQLVAETKFGYKWIKWLTRIELSNDPNYRGYWESKGYSNDATVP